MAMKMDSLLTVKEAAVISGVSVRTLHHYHKLGLLVPAQVTEAGYRLYGQAELARLQQILLYKELGFSLEEIRPLLSADHIFLQDALEKQTRLLMLKRKRLDKLIELTQNLLKGECIMDFAAFDTKEIDQQMEQYAQEVKERWEKPWPMRNPSAAWLPMAKRSGIKYTRAWAVFSAALPPAWKKARIPRRRKPWCGNGGTLSQKISIPVQMKSCRGWDRCMRRIPASRPPLIRPRRGWALSLRKPSKPQLRDSIQFL